MLLFLSLVSGAAAVSLDSFPQQAYLKDPQPSSAALGSSVALSGDGSVLAAGAPDKDSAFGRAGSVFVFRRGAGGRFSLSQRLDGELDGDALGISLDLNYDGSVLAVGASENGRGSVCIYEGRAQFDVGGRQRMRISGEFSRLGSSVAIDSAGDKIVAGAPFYRSKSSLEVGAVCVYERVSAQEWNRTAVVHSDFQQNSSYFGTSVSLSGDGILLAVGAPQEDSNDPNDPSNTASDASGAAYVFYLPNFTQVAYLKDSPIRADGQFGSSVALSSDGTTLAVMESSIGAVSVFAQMALSSWDRLHVHDPDIGGGGGLSLSSTGDVLVAGYKRVAKCALFSLDDFSNPLWLAASLYSSGDFFGDAVSLSHSGDMLAVGASREESGTQNPEDNSVGSAGALYLFYTPQSLSGVVNGTLVVGSPLVVSGGVLTVLGDVTLGPGSNLTLSQTSIVATGNVVVSGPLTLQVSGAPTDGQVIPLVSGASVTGEFSSISIESGAALAACEKLDVGQQNVGGSALQAIVSVDNSGCGEGGLHPGAIAGIAVGGALLVLVVALLLVRLQRHNKEVRTAQMAQELRDRDVQELTRMTAQKA